MIGTAFMGYSSIFKFNDFYISFIPSISLEVAKYNHKQKTVENFLAQYNIKPIRTFADLNITANKIRALKTLKSYAGVYIIINHVTKDFYIGSARLGNLYDRILDHLFYRTGNKPIASSLKDHGLQNISFTLLESIQDTEIIYKKEAEYLIILTPTFNIYKHVSYRSTP